MLKSFLASVLFLITLSLPFSASAAVPIFEDICRNNRQQNVEHRQGPEQESSICDDASQGPEANPLYGPRGIITIIVNLLSLVVGIAAVIGIIVAGIKYLTSASNPEEANKARELVIYAVIGLMLAAAAQALVRTVLHNIGV